MTRTYQFTAILSEKGAKPVITKEFVFQAVNYQDARKKLSDLIEAAKAKS